jgi:transposase
MGKTAIAVLGIELGKSSCSLAGQDAAGAVVLRRRLTRESLVKFVAGLPACVVAMEACCGAHLMGRLFTSQGHTVRLMSPEYVAPYVKHRGRTIGMRRRSPRPPPVPPCGWSR